MKTITTKEFRDAVVSKAATNDLSVAKESYTFEPTPASNVLKFVFSSKATDLSGDRVFPDGVDFKNYATRNPIVLAHHDLHSWGIGKTIDMSVVGDEIIGTIEFFTDLDEAGVGTNARAAVELIKRGVMGISITFIPKTFELNATDGIDFLTSYMLESSVCTVPCNPDSYLIPSPVVPDVVAASLDTSGGVNQRSRLAAWRSRSIRLS
jgi:hypothetical protein